MTLWKIAVFLKNYLTDFQKSGTNGKSAHSSVCPNNPLVSFYLAPLPTAFGKVCGGNFWTKCLIFIIFSKTTHYEAKLCILCIVSGFRNKHAPFVLLLFFPSLWSFRQSFTMFKDLSLESRNIQTQNCAPIKCTLWPRNARPDLRFWIQWIEQVVATPKFFRPKNYGPKKVEFLVF